MLTVHNILVGLSIVCFFLAMIGVPIGKEVKLIAAGLFLIAISLLV